MTNKASEGELSSEIDDYIDDIRYNNELPFDERLESAKKSIKHLIRTEKLKLLAEVRERVVGEDEKTHQLESPVWNFIGGQNALRKEQRDELNKLEAEL